MKLRSKEPYWLLKNGILQSYPTLRRNLACDILVVGGGITGSLMAFQLSKEGYNTVLIDRRDISLGSTSATTSMLQYEIDEPLYGLIEKVGEVTAVNCYQKGVESIARLGQLIRSNRLKCDFEQKKSLYFAAKYADRQWLEKEFTARAEYGFDVRWLNRRKIDRDYGLKSSGGILSEAGASVDAYQLAHELLGVAHEKYGLRIFDHTGMMNFNSSRSGHEVETEPGFRIKAKKIIFATGFETTEFLKDDFVKLVSTYAIVTEPLTKLPDNLKNTLFWNTGDPYLYMRTTDDNRILVGGEDELFRDAERRDKLIEKKEEKLVEEGRKIFPRLEFLCDFSWAGTFGTTKDSLPYVGTHDKFPDCYFVLGFGGNGITFSIMAMEIISDAIKGKYNPFLEYFRFGR